MVYEFSELINRLNTMERRLRAVEQEQNSLRQRMDSLDIKTNEGFKGFKVRLEHLISAMGVLESDMEKIGRVLEDFRKDLERRALKVDVSKIDRYLDLIDPLRKGFVTKEELSNIKK